MARIFNDYGMPLGLGQPRARRKNTSNPYVDPDLGADYDEQSVDATGQPILEDPEPTPPGTTPVYTGLTGGRGAATPLTAGATPRGSTAIPGLPITGGSLNMFPGDARQAIIAQYMKYLGRKPSEAEIQAQLGQTGRHRYQRSDVQSILNAIMGSEEAETYAATQNKPATEPTAPAAPAGTGSSPTDSYGNVLPGWDAGKWNDPNMQTTKYVIGRILSKYSPTPEGLQEAMAEIQKLFPNAALVGKDSISGLGGGPVDVIGNAGVPGSTWQWGDWSEGGGGGGTGTSGLTPGFFNPQNMNVNDPSFGQMVIQTLMALLNQQRGG